MKGKVGVSVEIIFCGTTLINQTIPNILGKKLNKTREANILKRNRTT